jgi:hypothetical protein
MVVKGRVEEEAPMLEKEMQIKRSRSRKVRK